MAHSKTPPWNPCAQFCRERAEEWISSSLAPWRQLFTQPSCFRVVFVTGFKTQSLFTSIAANQNTWAKPKKSIYRALISTPRVFQFPWWWSEPTLQWNKEMLFWLGLWAEAAETQGFLCCLQFFTLPLVDDCSLWGVDWFCLGFWDVEGLEVSPGNEEAINRQITKGKEKKSCVSVIYSWDVQQGSLKFPSPRGSWLASF